MSLAAAAVVAVASLAAGEGAKEQVVRVPLAAAEVATSRYREVPFKVPAGTTRIDIALSYDKASGATVLDLGLAEPGSLALPSRAFRGWSGGERAAIFVAVDDATPGYWPGAIPAGPWHVILGLYKVAAAGAEATLTIRTSAAPARATPPIAVRSAGPVSREARWYAGALHAHTTHSDGQRTPPELAADARAAGLDFLVITDHNNTAQQREAIDVNGLLVLTGEEITTPGGHANAWGLRGERAFIDFRVAAGDPRLASLVTAVHAAGGLFAVNHPFDNCVACSWTHDLPADIDALEITNPGEANTQQAIALWDTLLRAGRKVTAVGVSDWHRPGNQQRTIDVANTRVYATELSAAAILAGIKQGRAIVTASARVPVPTLVVANPRGEQATVGERLSIAPGDALRIEAGGAAPYVGGRVDIVWRGEKVATATVPADAPATLALYPAADGYVRAHFFGADGQPLAVTNPVWVEVQGR